MFLIGKRREKKKTSEEKPVLVMKPHIITRKYNGKTIVIRGRNREDLDSIEENLDKIKHHKRLSNGSRSSITDDERTATYNISVFRKHLKKIKKGGVEGEKLNSVILKSMLSTILDLIPIAEENYRKNMYNKSEYALNIYYNQAREIINDLRAIEDFETHASRITEVVSEHIRLILQNLIDEVYKLRANLIAELNLENSIKEKDVLNNAMKRFVENHGRYLNETNSAISARVSDFLINGNANVVGSKKGR
jgi:hypothetical protein